MSSISEEELEREVRTLKYVHISPWGHRTTLCRVNSHPCPVNTLTILDTCDAGRGPLLAQASYLLILIFPHQTRSSTDRTNINSTRPTTT